MTTYRTTIMIDEKVMQKLRKAQVKKITATNKSASLSSVINELLLHVKID